jgi:hypothetical protein
MASNLITIKSIMEELRGKSQDRNYGKDEHPAFQDEFARWKGKDSNKEMEFTDDDTEVENGQRRIGKKGKSNKITLTPNRPRVQVTPNEKTTGRRIEDPPKKSRYNKGQMEAFFGPGMRETAPGKQKDQSTRTKKAAELEEGYNKKARLEDEYSEESKEREKGFAVNLEAMDTPLRGKRSSRVTTAKALKIAKTASNVASTEKKKGKKSTFVEVASPPSPLEAINKQGFQYQKCIVGFAIRVDKGQKSKKNFDKKIREALFFLRSHIDED